MQEIGIFAAKTHLSELIRQVEAGESFIITVRGRKVAEVKPAQTARKSRPKTSMKKMLAWRDAKGPTLGPGLKARQLIDEGRR